LLALTEPSNPLIVDLNWGLWTSALPKLRLSRIRMSPIAAGYLYRLIGAAQIPPGFDAWADKPQGKGSLRRGEADPPQCAVRNPLLMLTVNRNSQQGPSGHAPPGAGLRPDGTHQVLARVSGLGET
jgi:hypothetical protein